MVIFIYFFDMHNHFNKIYGDNKAQGSAELILIIGGLIVIILVILAIYKSYLSDLGNNIESNEIHSLNSSFESISSKFK